MCCTKCIDLVYAWLEQDISLAGHSAVTHDTDPAATLWRAATMVSGTGRIQYTAEQRTQATQSAGE